MAVHLADVGEADQRTQARTRRSSLVEVFLSARVQTSSTNCAHGLPFLSDSPSILCTFLVLCGNPPIKLMAARSATASSPAIGLSTPVQFAFFFMRTLRKPFFWTRPILPSQHCVTVHATVVAPRARAGSRSHSLEPFGQCGTAVSSILPPVHSSFRASVRRKLCDGPG